MNTGGPLSFAQAVSEAQQHLQDALRAGMGAQQPQMQQRLMQQDPQQMLMQQMAMQDPQQMAAMQAMPQAMPQPMGSAMGSPQMGAPAQFAEGGLAVKKPATLPLSVRDAVKNPDGSTSTVRTISIGTDDGEVLIPTVINGRVVSDDEAIRHYERTGEHLGVFKSPEEATRYAKQLSGEHAAEIKSKGFARGGGAWTRKEGKNPEGGLNAKGRASLKAQGQDIKPPVSAKQAKKSPKSAARRKSFCARMGGMDGPMKDEKGRPTRKALALKKWDCKAQGGMVEGYAEGGKSRVNEAGNYTKPGMRKSLFESIKAGGKGGAPGQWSARKAQMLAKRYKENGGGYK